MIHARPRSRTLAAALTVALAAAGAAAPAFAAPGVSYAAEDQQSTTVPYPTGMVDVVGGGHAGFFTVERYASPPTELRWTRYADGTARRLPLAGAYDTGASDVLVTGDHATDIRLARVFTVRDLASGAAPYVVDLAALEKDGARYIYRGAVGTTLVFGVRNADGTTAGRLVTPGAQGPQERPIKGLPEGRDGFVMTAESADAAQLVLLTGPAGSLDHDEAVLDIASGEITDTFREATVHPLGAGAVSAGHTAWIDQSAYARVAVGTRGTGETASFEVLPDEKFALVGGWLVHGVSRVPENHAGGDHTLYAERLDGSGTPVRVLDRMGSLVPGPDGSLMARGGTGEHGEGLYRITAGTADAPGVELVATTGEPTELVYGGADIPAVIDLDRVESADFRWRLSRKNVRVTLAVWREDQGFAAKGRTLEPGDLDDMGPDAVGFVWRGEDFDTPDRGARAGTYHWRFTAEPIDGVGEPVSGSGTFTVRRTPGLHDVDGNGSPELFARGTGGGVTSLDVVEDAAGAPTVREESAFTTGWGVYDRIESSGDLAGTPFADLVTRDRDGVLWLHQGSGEWKQPLSRRVRIGGGWNTYDKLAGGSDLTGDGRADLVAADRAGVLWLYAGTGNASAPFTARKRVGGGWGTYNEVTAVGNLAGGPAGDLVARDRAGVLWLYLGKGDGTFAARTRIGGGWGGFTGLVGIGDVDGDRRVDLIAHDAAGDTFYRGTGAWRSPFAAGRRVGLTFGSDTAF
ncbi:FG-GAP repeat domain-containing protein [Streptomyces sp. NPDC058955]|uniref:FG-GAP repeat domain-containing protein n=1 Tax=unclassified Streptomyces TaxID=2593676 RepID=UPI00364EE160